MSAELRTITVTLTIRDNEHLPPGLTVDDVVSLMSQEVKATVSRVWLALDGGAPALSCLACEPEVT